MRATVTNQALTVADNWEWKAVRCTSYERNDLMSCTISIVKLLKTSWQQTV